MYDKIYNFKKVNNVNNRNYRNQRRQVRNAVRPLVFKKPLSKSGYF